MTATAERSYTHIDKSTWGDGPWHDEPDKVQWIDDESGLDCLIVRNRMGALCGYVGVPSEHPWHGVAYGGDGWDDDSAPDVIIEVHGGLSYSDKCQEDMEESKGICHVPLPGRPDDVWWFGFDCAHGCDTAPGYEARSREQGLPSLNYGDASYRTIAYVRAEVAKLAAQLAGASGGEQGRV